ncbi:AI-2E family transporter [Paenibacillus antarcticus]|uniref:AI-2E family transporter n=2 Tax=Paenibacillus antarcticus TaxID=253703 RepID=A0A168MR07_9BACL|nr:AI-2E family transporter [Paenibacillus antarcticus]OAB44956.1 AI-2E family transporter [Paenibacillus antarcticus]
MIQRPPDSRKRMQILQQKKLISLFVILMIGLIIFVFSKISYIFTPIKIILSTVSIPIILAAVAYYLLNPLVDLMERKKIKRGYSILILYALIIGLMTVLIVEIIPVIRNQVLEFVENLPKYSEEAQRLFENWIGSDLFSQIQQSLGFNDPNFMNDISSKAASFFNNTFKGIGTVVGAVTEFVLAFIIAPFILVYLLKDGKKLPPYFLKLLPTKIRPRTSKVLGEISHQISSFIRGQIIVSFCIGVLLYFGYLIIGLDYPVVLAIIAACTSMVPYLGPTIAITPAIIIALVTSPIMLLKMVVVWTIVQLIEGKFISPQIMGKTLKIHPITIIFVIIVSGKLFGVLGIILAVPGYAVLKVIVMNVFQGFKNRTDWYEPLPEVITQEEITVNEAVIKKDN